MVETVDLLICFRKDAVPETLDVLDIITMTRLY